MGRGEGSKSMFSLSRLMPFVFVSDLSIYSRGDIGNCKKRDLWVEGTRHTQDTDERRIDGLKDVYLSVTNFTLAEAAGGRQKGKIGRVCLQSPH